MDEVLIANFMIFQDAVDEGGYDLVIADEAWDIDHYWHEHPGAEEGQARLVHRLRRLSCRCRPAASTRPS